MATTVTNEQIIVALMNNGTLKSAAEAVGISTKTLNERMASREFKESYRSAKADIVRKGVFELNNQIGSAVETVVSIMNDTTVSAGLRLQAAQTILRYSTMFAQRLNDDEQTYLEKQFTKMHSYRI